MQLITLCGRLGSDIEEKLSKNNEPYWTFSFAVNPSKKSEETVWYRITCFRKLKPLDWLKKGSVAIVNGFLDSPKIYTSKSGEATVKLSVTAEVISFLPASKKKDEDGGNHYEPSSQSSQSPYPSVFDEDVPF